LLITRILKVKTMQSIVMTTVGEPEVLKLQDSHEPYIVHPTDVKVKLKAAGVNPIDTKLRRHGLFYDNNGAAILGCDGAGEVIEIGNAVTHFRVGDKVWFCHGGLGREQGNYAQYTVLDQRWISLMPPHYTFAQAAALPLVLITAWGALFDRGGLQPGQTVLIHAGAGGVGHIAIQLAKIRGARVITTVSSEEKSVLVKGLGADEVIFYHQDSFVKAVNRLTNGKGADVVLDTVSPAVFEESILATAHYGRLITLLDPGELSLAEARIRNLLIGFELMLTPMLRDLPEARDKHIAILKQCAHFADQGRLKPHISDILPLKEAVRAHKLIEQRHTSGKIVLTID
jgi:NADPH:quinone reductase